MTAERTSVREAPPFSTAPSLLELVVAAAFFSLIASARLHGLEPEGYMRDVLRVLQHWPKERYLELAPLNFSATRARLDAQKLEAELCPSEVSQETVTRGRGGPALPAASLPGPVCERGDGLFENCNRYYDPASGRYLAEPYAGMGRHEPWHAYVPAVPPDPLVEARIRNRKKYMEELQLCSRRTVVGIGGRRT